MEQRVAAQVTHLRELLVSHMENTVADNNAGTGKVASVMAGMQESTTQVVTNVTRESEKFADQLEAGQATKEAPVGSGIAQVMAQMEVMTTRAESFAKDAVALDQPTADGMANLQLLQQEAEEARNIQRIVTEWAFTRFEASGKMRMGMIEGFV